MDRLESMHYFVTAVETGSFSAAGRKLGVPTATLARKINDLEERLQTRLLTRTTRNLVLTDTGTSYLVHCRAILERVVDAEAEASGEYTTPKGELTVTAPIVFGRLHVLPVVNAFLANYPEINVRMTLADRNVNLVEDHMDLAVRFGSLADSTLKTTKIGQVRRVVVGSPAYFAAHGIPKALEDLAQHTCVTFSGMGLGGSWMFPGLGGEVLQPPKPRCRLNINTAEAAIDSAVAGLGLTHVLSYQVATQVERDDLRIVLDQFEPQPVPVNLVHAGQGHLPLKMRRFLEFAVPRLRKALAFEPATVI